MSKRRCVAVAVTVALPDDVWQCIMDQVELDDVTTVLNLLGTCHATGRMLWPRLKVWMTTQCHYNDNDILNSLHWATKRFWGYYKHYNRFWGKMWECTVKKELCLFALSQLIYVCHLTVQHDRLLYTDSKCLVRTGDRSVLSAPLSEVYHCGEDGVVAPVLEDHALRVMELGPDKVMDAHMARRVDERRALLHKPVPDDVLRALVLIDDEHDMRGSFAYFTRDRVTYREPRATDTVCDLVYQPSPHEHPLYYVPVWLARPMYRFLYRFTGQAQDARVALRLGLFIEKTERRRVKELYKNVI